MNADRSTVLSYTLAALRRGQPEYRYTPYQYGIFRVGWRWHWAASMDCDDGLSVMAGTCWRRSTAVERTGAALKVVGP